MFEIRHVFVDRLSLILGYLDPNSHIVQNVKLLEWLMSLTINVNAVKLNLILIMPDYNQIIVQNVKLMEW